MGMRLLNTLAMAALIEQGVNKGVNKPHSISSTLKVLFPRIPGEWYHSGISTRLRSRRSLLPLVDSLKMVGWQTLPISPRASRASSRRIC